MVRKPQGTCKHARTEPEGFVIPPSRKLGAQSVPAVCTLCALEGSALVVDGTAHRDSPSSDAFLAAEQQEDHQDRDTADDAAAVFRHVLRLQETDQTDEADRPGDRAEVMPASTKNRDAADHGCRKSPRLGSFAVVMTSGPRRY
jgi:hypothetical protein